jgi:hypothetical protein
MPELNLPLFAKIRDQITAHPELHEQSDFEYPSNCGTSRCVAGWAILLDAHGRGEQIDSFRESSDYLVDDRSPSDFARQLLGLTYAEADYLFFQAGNKEAVDIVKGCAAGVRFDVPADEE